MKSLLHKDTYYDFNNNMQFKQVVHIDSNIHMCVFQLYPPLKISVYLHHVSQDIYL